MCQYSCSTLLVEEGMGRRGWGLRHTKTGGHGTLSEVGTFGVGWDWSSFRLTSSVQEATMVW